MYLECIFFVKVTREYGKWNVNDDKCKDRCPNSNIFDQLLSQVVEYSGEVYRIDRCNKSRSKAAKQVTAKPHMPWSCRFHLIINIKLILIKIVYIYNYYKHRLAAHESATSRTLVVFYPRARRYTSAGNSDRNVSFRLSVCLSVRHSLRHAPVLSKRTKLAS